MSSPCAAEIQSGDDVFAGASITPKILRVIESLKEARSIAAFREACKPLGLGTDRRFIHLELDIVNRCNIRCIMCYHSLPETRVRVVFLDPSMFREAAESILPHASHLSLSLGNEPLMSPYFEEILHLAAPFKVPNVNFFTNGLLLNNEKIAAIIATGVTQVCISIDGATRSSYNAIRRGGEFRDLLSNVEKLISMRDQALSRTPLVRFDIVMMRRNIRELPDIVHLASDIGCDQVSMRHLVSFSGLGMEKESLIHAKLLSDRMLRRALEAALEHGIEVQSHPGYFNEPTLTQKAKVALRGLAKGRLKSPVDSIPEGKASPHANLPTPYCPFPFFHVSMGPGGHVLPCPHSHGEAPYGEISKQTPLDQIWLNGKFARLRRRILLRDPPVMCRRCPYLADKYPEIKAFFDTRDHR